jgi:hypothetical protein
MGPHIIGKWTKRIGITKSFLVSWRMKLGFLVSQKLVVGMWAVAKEPSNLA